MFNAVNALIHKLVLRENTETINEVQTLEYAVKPIFVKSNVQTTVFFGTVVEEKYFSACCCFSLFKFRIKIAFLVAHS